MANSLQQRTLLELEKNSKNIRKYVILSENGEQATTLCYSHYEAADKLKASGIKNKDLPNYTIFRIGTKYEGKIASY